DGVAVAETSLIGSVLETRANRRLIAAAPDMLAALENLENDDGKAVPESTRKMVQDAITKARGEAQ
ncbi:MAG: hypothetical protein AAFW98_07290, partial [Pseudomonadota bacterium]